MQDSEGVARNRAGRSRLAVAAISAAALGVFGAGGAFAATTVSHSGSTKDHCNNGQGSDNSTPSCGQPRGSGSDDDGSGGSGGGSNPLQQLQDAIQSALSQLPPPPGGGGGSGTPYTNDCSMGGVNGATVAYQLDSQSPFFTGNLLETGPISSQINSQIESQAGQGAPFVHELGCAVAVFDTAQPPSGGGVPAPLNDLITQIQQALSQLPAPPGGGGGRSYTDDCSAGGVNGATVAYQLDSQSPFFTGSLAETGPISSQINQQIESQAGPAAPLFHELGCAVAAFDTAQPPSGGLPVPIPSGPPSGLPVPIPSGPPSGLPVPIPSGPPSGLPVPIPTDPSSVQQLIDSVIGQLPVTPPTP